MIESHRDQVLNLTTFTCTGKTDPAEVQKSLREFYEGTPTLHTIWDYRAADISALTADRISQIAGFLKQAAHSRAGDRSALVFTLAQLTDMNDRLPSMAELTIDQATIKIFDSMEKAHAWVIA